MTFLIVIKVSQRVANNQFIDEKQISKKSSFCRQFGPFLQHNDNQSKTSII